MPAVSECACVVTSEFARNPARFIFIASQVFDAVIISLSFIPRACNFMPS